MTNSPLPTAGDVYTKYVGAALSTYLDSDDQPSILAFTSDVTREVDVLAFFRSDLQQALQEKLAELPKLQQFLARTHARWIAQLDDPSHMDVLYKSIATAMCPVPLPNTTHFAAWYRDSLLVIAQSDRLPQGERPRTDAPEQLRAVATTLIANNPPLVYVAVAVLQTRLKDRMANPMSAL